MRILFTHNAGYHLTSSCCLCGGRFIPDTVLATAIGDNAVEIGIVCDDCLQDGASRLHQRLARHAALLHGQANVLQDLVGEGMALPRVADWHAQHPFAGYEDIPCAQSPTLLESDLIELVGA